MSEFEEYNPSHDMIAKSITQPGVITRLYQRKEHLENELAQVNKAIASIEKNPQVAEALENISKVSGVY